MLTIFQPSGFDGFLAEMAQMDEADFADEAKVAALNAKYDIVQMGPVPDHPEDAAGPPCHDVWRLSHGSWRALDACVAL